MSGHLLQSSLRVIAHQPLGDTAGLAGRPILNGLTLDMDEEGGVHKLGRLASPKAE